MNRRKSASESSTPKYSDISHSRRHPAMIAPQKWFYQKNKKLLEHPLNKTFEEVLWMKDSQFREWIVKVRKLIVNIWDNDGTPPTVGLDELDIIKQFEKIESFKTGHFLKEEVSKRKHKVIVNTSTLGLAGNQWFPTMMKTKINYSNNLSEGLSIYDHFKNDDLLEKFIKYAFRHFKRDSFYHYSQVVPKYATDRNTYLFECKTGQEWIKRFEQNSKKLRQTHDYWLSPISNEDAEYTGYSEQTRNKSYLTIKRSEVEGLPIPDKCKTILPHFPESTNFKIRVFEKGQRIFPLGLKAFRISLCQYAVNFPPMIARFLYERYLDRLGVKQGIIWDPSAGWGGRLIGAMGLNRAYKVHYIGTDPNTDFITTKGRTKYHELADFYNEVRIGKRRASKKKRRLPSFCNTYEIYQCGSELMDNQPAFQKYRGKIDIVFTSPPYFGKELYSDDPGQSAIKFDAYTGWREGFLRKTLENAVEWLKPGGFLLWNIANIKMGTKRHYLENDSCKILSELGMKRIEILKMGLRQMPGANRVDSTVPGIDLEDYEPQSDNTTKTQKRGKIKAPHGCYVDGMNGLVPLKYEPIFVWQKPARNSKSTRAQNIPDLTDVIIRITEAAQNLQRVLKSNDLNFNQMRNIYAVLDDVDKDSEKKRIINAFNKNRKLGFYLGRRTLPFLNDSTILQFSDRKTVNTSNRRLINTTVVVQFVNKGKNKKPHRTFAIGKVVRTDADRSQSVWVKISVDKKYAERARGLIVEIPKSNLLMITAAKPNKI